VTYLTPRPPRESSRRCEGGCDRLRAARLAANELSVPFHGNDVQIPSGHSITQNRMGVNAIKLGFDTVLGSSQEGSANCQVLVGWRTL